MSRWRPCKRREFIRRLGKLGFDGPYSGARHQFMVYELHRLTIPSNTEYSVPQVRMPRLASPLKGEEQGEGDSFGRQITAEDWNRLR